MSSSGNGKKNGGNPDHEPSPLEAVEAKLAAAAEEERSGVVDTVDEAGSDDPARKWKRLEDKQLTLEVLHQGLIAVSQYSEAAIEGGIKMAADLNRALPTIERLASKTETTSSHVHQVDEDVAKLTRTVNGLRKDVQFVKDTVAEMQAPIRQIPAIKDMLGEILGRLPAPKKARPKRKKTG